MAVLIALLGAVAFVVGFVVLSAAINGWALMLLWNWFAVPLLGLPPIVSIPAAVGLGLVVSLLTSRRYAPPKSKGLEATAYPFVHPLATVLIGYLLRRFFM